MVAEELVCQSLVLISEGGEVDNHTMGETFFRAFIRQILE